MSKTNLNFASMSQCAAQTNIPLAFLKRWKRAGCPGFLVGNRVDLAEVLKWVYSRRDIAPPVTATDALALSKMRLTDHKLEVESGRYIPKDDVVSFIQQTFNPVREVFMSLPAELSAKLNGSDPGEHFAILQNYADEALKKCREHSPK